MYIGVFDIEQYDCPVVKLTERREGVTTTVLSVNVSELPRGLEQIYLIVSGKDGKARRDLLEIVAKLPGVKSVRVMGRSGDTWRIYMYISKTHTMEASVNVGAMFVSPWIASGGVERWTLGFVNKKQLYEFLSRIRERDHVRGYHLHEVPEEDFVSVTANYLQIIKMVSQLNRLTSKQLELLRIALSKGYYSWPKGTDSVELSRMLGISRVSLIKSLRRAELKVLSAAVDFLLSSKRDWERSYT